jgi:AcrR family transcriptional regulator
MIRRMQELAAQAGVCSPGDHRRKPRRRGLALDEAIHQATMDELKDVGYGQLTMERVAARAHASKASLYRRWPSRAELVVDALRHHMPDYGPTPDTGDLRDDLLTLFRKIAANLAGPLGEAGRGLIADVLRNEDLREALRTQLIDPSESLTLDVLRRALLRGEVRPGALSQRVATVGPTLLRQHFMLNGDISEATICEIVDEVVLPLVRVPPAR